MRHCETRSGRRTRAPGGHVANPRPPSVMNSRRFNWSNGIRRPVTRGPLVEYRIGEDRSGGDGTIFQPVSGWRARPMADVEFHVGPPPRSSRCQAPSLTWPAPQPAMTEIIMRPTRSLVRAALSASLLSTLPPMLGVSAMLAECSVAIAGDNVLKALKPVTDEMLHKPGPGDWLMRRGDCRAWGYSTLDQIRAGNVGALKLAWAWNMEPGYQEEAPLVHDGVIFLGNPQNVVQALDGRTGDLLWEYRRELPKIEGGYHN